MKIPKIRKNKSFCFLLGMIFLIGATGIVCNGYVLRVGQSLSVQEVSKLEPAQAVVVLGAGVYTNGRLTPILRDRVDTALAVYLAGKAERILVSGDNSSLEYNEVVPVRQYLLSKGVPPEHIFLDYAGFNTYDSLYRAKEIFQVESVVVVTQEFHLPRAVFVGAALDISTQGISSRITDVYTRNHWREMLARVKTVGEVLVKRQSKFLGEKIPITGDGRVTAPTMPDESVPTEDTTTDLITVTKLQYVSSTTSFVHVAGSARGQWFFEATAPVEVVNESGALVGQGYIEAKASWMTENYVPFVGKITIDADQVLLGSTGVVVLRKANASGLPEYDAYVEVPVLFSIK